MSEIQANKISPATGTGLTLGDSGDTLTLTAGANLILGGSSTTITIPSGATITNSGTATGFGEANTPNFHAKNTSQSISASTNTVVVYSSEDFDTSSLYSTSTGRFTVDANTTGKYFFYACVKYAASSISRNDITINKNGTSVLRTEFGNSTTYPTVLVSGMVNLSSSGDYVEVKVNQNDGTKSLSGEPEGNFFGGFRVTAWVH